MASPTAPRRPTPRERLQPLYDEAESLYIDNSQELKRYFVAGKHLFETASYEAKHRNDEKAFLLVLRFLDLFVTRLPKHPKYQRVPDDLRNSTKILRKEAMKLAEDLKAQLMARYAEEDRLDDEEEERRRQQAPQSLPPQSHDFDALAERIGRLNTGGFQENFGAPQEGIVCAGANHSVGKSSSGESWTSNSLGGRIGTEAWPSNVHVDYSPSNESHPMVDRATKPRPPPRGRISSSEMMRTVRLPSDLVALFATAASHNTRDKNIETCGNLWGIRDKGEYVVTHVLIPQQTATDSYCEDLDEGTASDFAIANNLIQLGWIHTHPSQTAFLSSVDMHMQHGYQIMLPEAVAIVLAPSFDDVGIFRLTDYGMDVVTRCREGTTFHVHDETYPMFERVTDVEEHDENRTTVLKDFR